MASEEYILTKKGIRITVCPCHYKLASAFSWSVPREYAMGAIYVKSTGKTTQIVMHRLITGAHKGDIVDHINGNTLDNRCSNLRLCTPLQNARNTHARRSSSGYKGVHRLKTSTNWKKPWVARIGIEGERVYLGKYKTAEEAAKKYDEAALEHFGEFANLNFPVQ
jgi:hypothetical protein